MLKLERDHVLRAMVEGLGAQVESATLPFEPEAGAYAHGHAHAPGRVPHAHRRRRSRPRDAAHCARAARSPRCCSSRARRCRSARTRIRRGSSARSTMADRRPTTARRRWILDVAARAARALRGAGAGCACTRACDARRRRARSRTGTSASRDAARRASCAPRRCRWARRSRSSCGVRTADCGVARARAALDELDLSRGVRRVRASRSASTRATASSRILWSWLENQVAAALKAVPLGQVAGQRMLLAAHGAIAEAVERRGCALDDDDSCRRAPGLALACALPRDAVFAAVPLMTR